MNSLYVVVMLSSIRLNMIPILNCVYFRAVKVSLHSHCSDARNHVEPYNIFENLCSFLDK